MKKNILLFSLLIIASLVVNTSCEKDDDDDSDSRGKEISSLVSQYDSNNKDSISFTYTDGVLTGAVHFELSPNAVKSYENEFIYENGKLVSIISYDWNGNTKIPESKDSLAYDSKNRIEKIIDFYYSNNKFVLDEDDVTTIEYNSSNQPIKFIFAPGEYNTFEYDAKGNMVTSKYYEDNQLDETETYTYDSKKNPFKGFYFAMDDIIQFYSTNNAVKMTEDDVEGSDGVEDRTYEYDKDGYPIKMTSTYEEPGETPYISTFKIYYK